MAKRSSNGSNLIDGTPKNYGAKNKAKLSDRISSALSRLHFDPHHTIYRKAFEFSFSLILMIGFAGFGMHNSHVFKMEQAETLTNYSSHVAFSHSSNTDMKIDHIRLSNDRRTAYIPFSFNNMDSVSENANKYLIRVGAVNGYMKHPMVGQMVIFGPTARGVILLHSREKIANQPVYVIVRNLADITSDSGTTDDSNGLVGSSTSSNMQAIQDYEHKHDALHFKVNPGAHNSIHDDKLSTNDHLSGIYNQLFGRPDYRKARAADSKSWSQIRTNIRASHEYESDLRRLGFRVPKPPKWMSRSWRPYDAIMSNGVPRNEAGKANAKDVANDAAYSPVNDNDDTADNVKFPSVLKKKDGTTTNSSNQSNLNSGDDENNGGDDDTNHINGGDVNSPAQMWSNLQQAWDEVLKLKHNIYTTNAATIFKIKATVSQQNNQSTIGDKDKFKELN